MLRQIDSKFAKKNIDSIAKLHYAPAEILATIM
jgi:hypothetical protein